MYQPLPNGWRLAPNGVHEKQCKHCERWQPAGLYHADATRKDGRRAYCPTCVREYLRRKLRRKLPPASAFNGFGTFRRHRSLAQPESPSA